MAVSTAMGSCPPTMERGLQSASVSGTTFVLDSNFTNATSGDSYSIRFSAPVSQTNAAFTVYAFMTARTGSPTDMRAAVFAGPSGVMDAQRPDTGAALGTSAAVDVSAQTVSTWTTFSISSLSLTAGATYWLVIYNNTGTPASNHATYMTRGYIGNVLTSRFPAYTNTDGFTTDPTIVSGQSEAAIVMKFSDGSLLGDPYVVTTSPTSNTNDRGNRYTFDAATVVSGVVLSVLNNSNLTAIKVYQGASEVASVTADRSVINNPQAVYFDAPLTFAAATAYDVVGKYGGNTLVGARVDAGTSPPTDVANCMPSGLKYVNGATPGSYSPVDGATGILLLVDNVPAAAGGSGGGSYAFCA